MVAAGVMSDDARVAMGAFALLAGSRPYRLDDHFAQMACLHLAQSLEIFML
jgi:hypothetical protein